MPIIGILRRKSKKIWIDRCIDIRSSDKLLEVTFIFIVYHK